MALMTYPWDETKPAGTDGMNTVDDRIREMKQSLREVIAVDHVMAASGDDSGWGKHNKVTLKYQAADQVAGAGEMCLYTKQVSGKAELFFYDEDGNYQQLTSGGRFTGGMQYEVRMWSGLTANIPTGWVLCDGTNSTPNLTNKFIRSTVSAITVRAWSGAGAFATGGADSVTLAETNLPAHTHSCGAEGSHTHSGTTASAQDEIPTSGPGGVIGSSYTTAATYANNVYTQGHTHAFSTGGGSAHAHSIGSVGSGTAFNTMPAYVELAFIMKS